MVGVGAAHAVLAWTEEKKETNTGRVADGLLGFRPPLIVAVNGLKDGDRDWVESGRWRVLLCVSCEMSAQVKVDISQLVVLSVAGPHG